MSGTVNLNGPSYMPTLFGWHASDVSLLSTLNGEAGPDPAAGTPVIALEQAPPGGTKQIAARVSSKRDVTSAAARKPLLP